MKIDNRLTMLIVGVLAIAGLAGGWFLGVEPQLSAASATDVQLEQAVNQNQVTQAQVISLKATKSKLPALNAALSKLKLAVPEGVDGSALLAAVSAMASSAGASISGFALTAPGPYVVPVVAVAPVATAGPTGTTNTNAAPAAATATALVPYSDPAISPSNFAVIPFTTSATAANPQALLNFLQSLQTADRLVLVTAAGLAAPAAGQPAVYTLTVSGSVYMTRSTSPSGSATPTPSGSPTPAAKP